MKNPFSWLSENKTHQNTEKKRIMETNNNLRNINVKHFELGFWPSYIPFEITRDSYNLIGSNWFYLFKSHYFML